MLRFLSVLALPVLFCASAANADVFLSGVVAYQAGPTGASTSEPSEFDNIIGTGNSPVDINGQPRGSVFLLADGINNFTFTGPGFNNNTSGFYFSPTNAAFSRPFATTPDLVAYTFSGVLLTPAAGTQVQTNGQFSGTKPYSGALFYSDGVDTVTVTNYAVDGNGIGTFQLTVAPVPEPTLGAVLALAPLLGVRRRRPTA